MIYRLIKHGHSYRDIMELYSERRMITLFNHAVISELEAIIRHNQLIQSGLDEKGGKPFQQDNVRMQREIRELTKEAVRLANRVPLYRAFAQDMATSHDAFAMLASKGGKRRALKRAVEQAPEPEEALKAFQIPKTVPFSAQKRKSRKKA